VTAIELRPPGIGVGLYRPRRRESADLAYVGQGNNIIPRIRVHLRKQFVDGNRQTRWFSGNVEVSWVELPGVAKVNLLDHETDLVASHLLATGRRPWAQFLG
jgi:hypothetical protein